MACSAEHKGPGVGPVHKAMSGGLMCVCLFTVGLGINMDASHDVLLANGHRATTEERARLCPTSVPLMARMQLPAAGCAHRQQLGGRATILETVFLPQCATGVCLALTSGCVALTGECVGR